MNTADHVKKGSKQVEHVKAPGNGFWDKGPERIRQEREQKKEGFLQSPDL